MGWFTSFLYSQFFVTLPKPTKSFSGETIIVTGSNTGLGLEAARHLSRLNATLIILAVRNTEKGETAKKNILASTGRKDNSIEVWDLDMQSYESIQIFCTRAKKLARLDAVLLNAGIMTKHFKMVAGYESVITTNVIGTFLLALGMLPKLRESAAKYNIQPRLSVVASDLHWITKFPERHSKDIFEALNNEKTSVMGMERYATSKLLQVLAVRELAARIALDSESKSPAVIINCMTPGACRSDFNREAEGIGAIIQVLMENIIARTTEAGSRTLVHGVSVGEETHGKYMKDCVIGRPGPLVRGADGMALQNEVWGQLLIQLETIQPGITKNI